MKQVALFALVVLVVIGLGTTDLIAQPPGMPGAPSQAPIDGGLSLLALGGGAFALKKLRNRNK
ncbi:hypothetical protein EP331_05410 [bacterium]|nr:MAG: hypothetical protein EP331_05410 [bacterium]